VFLLVERRFAHVPRDAHGPSVPAGDPLFSPASFEE
jgi:hypothetical protein